MAILVYGPVLLLRELAIRWNLGLKGYILLGLVYGLYNEGLFGRTIFQLQIANTAFDHYGIVWHTNLSWTAVIIIFHAFYAFLFPLVIVYTIFPKAAFVPWLNKKWWVGISVASFLAISYKFLENTWPVTPLHYVVLIAIMLVLVFLASWFRSGLACDDKKQRLWLVAYGIIFVIALFTISAIIATYRIPVLYFLAYCFAVLLLAVMLLNKKYGIPSLLVFALSAQLGFSICAIIVSVTAKSTTGAITSSILALVFAVALINRLIAKKTQADTLTWR